MQPACLCSLTHRLPALQVNVGKFNELHFHDECAIGKGFNSVYVDSAFAWHYSMQQVAYKWPKESGLLDYMPYHGGVVQDIAGNGGEVVFNRCICESRVYTPRADCGAPRLHLRVMPAFCAAA
jgi:hypothetical protein